MSLCVNYKHQPIFNYKNMPLLLQQDGKLKVLISFLGVPKWALSYIT